MVVGLTLDEHLAAQAQAAAQHLSVEALALQLLAHVIDNGDDAAWQKVVWVMMAGTRSASPAPMRAGC